MPRKKEEEEEENIIRRPKRNSIDFDLMLKQTISLKIYLANGFQFSYCFIINYPCIYT